MSSTNFGSRRLIFGSCVVGACNILDCYTSRMGEFFIGRAWEGFYFLSTIMVRVGIFTLDGEF